MSFTTPVFFLFFTVVAIIFYSFPRQQKWWILLSCIFFIAFKNPESLVILAAFTFFNFILAKNLEANNNSNSRKALYIAGLIINSGSVLFIKFLDFETSNTVGINISAIHFRADNFIFALGFSFYTLQNIAYLTDVFLKKIKAENNLLNFSVYSAFFPKFVSGPIVLAQEFLPQLKESIKFKSENLVSGGQRMVYGFIKKVVIADRLIPAVNSIFDYPDSNYGLTTLAASFLFLVQLYFDFSGYTDMALGASKVLGIKLKENFNFPFRATSISDFWRRWHISLIEWLTNYIYYPVTYYLRGHKRWAALTGIFVTLFVSGIWHGLGWTFIIYSMCHACYLSYELLTKKFRIRLSEKIPRLLYNSFSIIITLFFMTMSLVFFRSSTVDNAVGILNEIFNFTTFYPSIWLYDFISPLAVGGHQEDQFNLFVTLILTAIGLIFEPYFINKSQSNKIQWGFLFCSVLLVMLFGVFGSSERFIYMQF